MLFQRILGIVVIAVTAFGFVGCGGGSGGGAVVPASGSTSPLAGVDLGTLADTFTPAVNGGSTGFPSGYEQWTYHEDTSAFSFGPNYWEKTVFTDQVGTFAISFDSDISTYETFIDMQYRDITVYTFNDDSSFVDFEDSNASSVISDREVLGTNGIVYYFIYMGTTSTPSGAVDVYRAYADGPPSNLWADGLRWNWAQGVTQITRENYAIDVDENGQMTYTYRLDVEQAGRDTRYVTLVVYEYDGMGPNTSDSVRIRNFTGGSGPELADGWTSVGSNLITILPSKPVVSVN